jgi:MYXO-CTERM domain-containing protein
VNIRLALAAVATAAVILPAAAFAHVTVHPNALPSGGFTVINVNVPNEKAGPATTKVDVQFPPGYIFVSPQALPGWRVQVINRKLAKPVTVFGEQHTEEIDRVVWSSGTGIAKGRFMQFPLSVAVPAVKAGTVLTFKAVQTYSDGTVARWIGSPSSDKPAPQVIVKPAGNPVQDFPGGVSAARKSSSAHIATAALVGLLGLGGLAFYRKRR